MSVLLLCLTPKYLALQSIKGKTTVTHNDFPHCRVHFYTFVRQPFSKQLYIYLSKTMIISNKDCHTNSS